MKGSCYVSMPFGRRPRPHTGEEVDFDAIFLSLIQPAVEEHQLECVRADSYGPGLFLQSLLRSILDSELVIADLTVQNPNVLYELGIRHALRPTGTILIQAEGGTVPFNLSGVMVMFYPLADGRVPEEELRDARKRIGHLIERTLRADRVDSPVYAMLPDLVAPETFRATGTGSGTGAGTGTGSVLPGGRERLRKSARSMVEQFGTGTGDLQQAPERMETPEEETVEARVPLSVILEEFRRAGDQDATIAYVDQLPSDKSQDRAAVHELALALSKRGSENDLDRAVAVCEDLVAREGGDPDTLGILGYVLRARYQQRGGTRDLEDAVRAYRRAFELRPTEPSTGYAAVKLLQIGGQLEPQEELLAQVRDALRDKYSGLPPEAWEFWDLATRFDLAIFARDWPAADETVTLLLSASTGDWELETIRRNLENLAASSTPEDQEPIARLGERLGFGSMTE